MTDWRDDAACIGHLELMMSERADQVPYAKSLCARCPSLVPCRQWAIDNEERYGVWGGTTPRERGFRPQRSHGWRIPQGAVPVRIIPRGIAS